MRTQGIQEEADLLEDSLGVGREDGVLPHGDERVVELLGVGEVEVAAEREVARGPRAAPEVGVARREAVTAARSVAQVPHQQLAAEVEVALHRLGELRVDHPRGDVVVVLPQQRLEDLVERVALDAPLAEHERLARRGVELHAGHARAVLAAIVLFLHQQEQLVETVERRAILLLVPLQVLRQPDQGNAAFVPKGVAHRRLPTMSAGPTPCPAITR